MTANEIFELTLTGNASEFQKNAQKFINQRFSSNDCSKVDPNSSGIGLIHWVAINNRPTYLRFLIEAGWNIELKDFCGRTSLHYAASNANEECFEILTSSNADLTATENEGLTLMHYAVMGGSINIVNKLMDMGIRPELPRGPFIPPLHYATFSNQREMLANMVSRVDCVNSVDKNGATPLHYAACAGNLELVDVLLKNGADQTILDPDGKSMSQLLRESRIAESNSENSRRTHGIKTLVDIIRIPTLLILMFAVNVLPVYCWLGMMLGNAIDYNLPFSLSSTFMVIFSFDFLSLLALFISAIPMLGQIVAVYAAIIVWNWGVFEAIANLYTPVAITIAALLAFEALLFFFNQGKQSHPSDAENAATSNVGIGIIEPLFTDKNPEFQRWLNSIGMGKYYPLLVAHKISMNEMNIMSQSRLQEIIRNGDDSRLILSEFMKLP